MNRRETRDTLHLAVPVVLTQLGAMAMGIVDTIMVGHLGAGPLSAVALGNSLSITVIVVCMGTLMALDPVVAQAYGARRFGHCGAAMRHGAVLAVLLSIPAMALLSQSNAILRALRQPEDLALSASRYVSAINWGVVPFLLFTVLRQFLQGISRPRAAMVIVLVANLLNVFGNWLLIYGNWGMPRLEAAGAAWATTLCRWFMLLALAAYVFTRPSLRQFAITERRPLDRALTARLVRVGLPVGFQFGLEVGVFAAASVLMGWLGEVALAGHQIALNLCSTSYMVPLGLSSTAAVRVGQALGRRDVAGARRAAFTAYALGMSFMALAALCFSLFPDAFVRIYTRDAELGAMGVSLLLIGAAFQLSDGTQTIAIGALRGAADTRFPMLIAAIGYWCIGLPFGHWLAFRAGLGAVGLWWGLTCGLTVVGLVLALRFHYCVRDERLPALQAL